MKALLIAEKASLRKTIQTVYNKHQSKIPYDITFTEQSGHLLTLKTPDEIDEVMKTWSWDTLPFHPEEHGGWQYKLIPEQKAKFTNIRDELKTGEYDFVINAGDPDQEGELLIRIVLSAIGNKLPVKRYWSNDTTEGKVLEALKNLLDDDKDPMLVNLLSAAYGRQHSDYRYGMNVSRAATLKMGARAACGRVKTTMLAIVCKREKEIENFNPSTCYGIKADYAEGFPGQLYDEASIPKDEKEADEKSETASYVWFDTEEEAKMFCDRLSPPAKVVKFQSRRIESYAPKLFKLATAQIAAGKLGYNSSQTLEIIQSLYEKGYLSYPRTNCEYMSSGENLPAMLKSAACVPELAPFVNSIDPAVVGKVRKTKKWVNDEALKEEGHSALVPTTSAPDFYSLTNDEQVIYRLICRQFVAIFLPPLIQDKTLLVTDISGNTFKSVGKTIVDTGYTSIFGTKFTDTIIPPHAEGDILSVNKIDLVSKTTTCPKHFTDADLIAVCDAPHKFLDDKSLKSLGKDLKIGTPATRSSIIKELIIRDKYLQMSKEKRTEYIIPTAAGMTIYENLKDCDICKVDMTGEWELKLEMVRKGEMPLPELEAGMKEHVTKLVDDIRHAEMTVIKKEERAVVGKCPRCSGNIISGTKGFYCSNYKEGCKAGAYKAICDSMLTDAEFAKLLSGQNIRKIIKKGSSKWEQELTYNIAECKVEFVQAQATESAYKCPKCGKSLTDNSRTIQCDDTCGFTFWKTSLGKILTKAQIDSFFKTGNTGLVKGLKSKAGKTFDAFIVLNQSKSGTEFKFPEIRR